MIPELIGAAISHSLFGAVVFSLPRLREEFLLEWIRDRKPTDSAIGDDTGHEGCCCCRFYSHFVATAVRLWNLGQHIDRRVLIHCGICSAVGTLVGTLLQSRANSPVLTGLFGALLLFAGLSGLTGWSERMRFRRGTAWIAGALSGPVGNQGGIRSAALLSFQMQRRVS